MKKRHRRDLHNEYVRWKGCYESWGETNTQLQEEHREATRQLSSRSRTKRKKAREIIARITKRIASHKKLHNDEMIISIVKRHEKERKKKREEERKERKKKR